MTDYEKDIKILDKLAQIAILKMEIEELEGENQDEEII